MTEQVRIVAWTVHGGYRLARSWWTQPHGEDWDQEHEFLSDTIYPTAAQALEAFSTMRKR